MKDARECSIKEQKNIPSFFQTRVISIAVDAAQGEAARDRLKWKAGSGSRSREGKCAKDSPKEMRQYSKRKEAFISPRSSTNLSHRERSRKNVFKLGRLQRPPPN